jgi:putative transposase
MLAILLWHQWVRDTVCKWRSRWLALAPKLKQAEAGQVADADLRAFLHEGLADLPRSGAPPAFTPEQVISIVALACEEPALSGLPFTHWTPQTLADEAQKRGYVESISATQVWRFLKSGAVTTASRGGLAASRTGRPGIV